MIGQTLGHYRVLDFGLAKPNQSRQFAISSCRELSSLVPHQHSSPQAKEESKQEHYDDQRQCRAAQQELRDEREAPVWLEVHRVRLVERSVHFPGSEEVSQQVPRRFSLEIIEVTGVREVGKHDLLAVL